MYWIGVDHHKRNTYVTSLDAEGKISFRGGDCDDRKKNAGDGLGLDRNGTYPARADPEGLAGPGRKIKENFFDFYPG